MGFKPDVIIVDTLENSLNLYGCYRPPNWHYELIRKQLVNFRRFAGIYDYELWVSHNMIPRGRDDVCEPTRTVIACSDLCLQIHTNDLLLSKDQIMYQTIKNMYGERRKLFLGDL